MDRDGYTPLQLGAGVAKAKNVTSRSEQFRPAEVEPKAKVVEFRVAEDALLDLGVDDQRRSLCCWPDGRYPGRDPG
jgi:large subunit ribosomal protein L3